jgi:para-aminobenzoate synthetase component 1
MLKSFNPECFLMNENNPVFLNDPDRIRLKMNKSGESGIPFLFGVNFEITEGFFLENPLTRKDILFQINGTGNNPTGMPRINKKRELRVFPESNREYKLKFDIVRTGLRRGDSFLTNLTTKTLIETNLSLFEIFSASDSPYRLFVPDRFVCFSPERFVKIADGIISTNPMKGTIDASIPDAEQQILNDFKETAEHSTVVDLLRNDLSLVAENVRVSRFRYTSRIKTREREILQVSSEITGELASGYLSRLGSIIFDMLPAGSISGAPKPATLQIIREAEKENRGYYTGVFGYFDGRVLDTGVMIRFIEKRGECLYFRSGGGITAYSVCDDEYREVLNKIYLPFI